MAQNNTYTVTAQGDTRTTYLTNCVVDSDSDISTLPTDWMAGSTANVIESGNTYVLSNKKQWLKRGSANASSGGGSGTITIDTSSIIAEAVKQSNLYTDEKVNEIQGFTIKIVTKLPTEDIDRQCLYFVSMKGDKPGEHMFYQYVYTEENTWLKVGGFEADLSPYWTSEEVKEYVDNMLLAIPVATTTTLGLVMADGESIIISEDGTISVNMEYINDNVVPEAISEDDIANLFK